MGTKENPGVFDGYAKALHDEPMFTLLARDPDAPGIVRAWVQERCARGVSDDDRPKIQEAADVADAMTFWRGVNENLDRVKASKNAPPARPKYTDPDAPIREGMRATVEFATAREELHKSTTADLEAFMRGGEPILQYFGFMHLPDHLRDTSFMFATLAVGIVGGLPRCAERTVALRKLLEAKDAAVRSKITRA